MQTESNPTINSGISNHASSECSDFQPGAIVGGRYKVVSLLGVGGMGVVYRVNQIFIDKQFALKTIDKLHITDIRIRRFQQEARAAFAVDHPNIIAVNDFGLLDDETPFLVMEIIEGETLGDRLKRTGHLTIDEVIPIFVQTCFGLAYAHEHGIVHRDIKPSNLMILDGLPLATEGSVKIVDFGIAKFAQHDDGEIQALTRTGEIFGSPLYMSPEQCAGENVDHRADIYSLGCVLFEALTSTPPFVGENVLSTMMQHMTAPAPTLKEASLGTEFPPELETVVAKMLDKSPENRYQNLGVVAHCLAALKRGESIASTNKPAKPKAQPETKTISMPNSKFYALLSGACVLSAALAGVSGYLLHQPPKIEQAPAMIEDFDPYCKTEQDTDGKKYFVAQFPPVDLGTFNDSPTHSFGKFKWLDNPIGKKSLKFHPSAEFLHTPKSFDVFPPNELVELDLKNSHIHDTISNNIRQSGALTNLQRLDLDASDITDADLNEIEKLPALSVLSLNSTNIHGSALAQMSKIRKLTNISFSNCKGARDLLAAVKGSHSLERLSLDGDHLTPADFETIGTLTNLRFLQVNDNHIQNAEFAALTSLTQLKELVTNDFQITADSIQPLKTMRKNGLENLTVCGSRWLPEEKSQIFLSPGKRSFIQSIIPNTKFIDFSNSTPMEETALGAPNAPDGFSFPPDITVGIIKIGQHEPVSAYGNMPAEKTDEVHFYTRYASHDYPEILDKFGSKDLTGLDVIFTKPEKVIEKIKDWKRLEDLSFFNSIIKALHNDREESPVTDQQLPMLDKFTHLKSLGLCGPLVSGSAIAKMSLLKSLTAIKLRRIKDIEPLLKALADRDNIKEVWLVAQDTDNKQLELLTKMKNLQTLRIRRSKLSPDSLAIFSRMPALKHLILDRNIWSSKDKERFKKKIRDCQFEPLIDTRYWELFKP